ncbi:MAG: hypothetical protein ACE5PO_03170 [Candidatus Bathyarchaeia archaeon]
MSEKTVEWELEEGGARYELYVKKGRAFTDFRVLYKESGVIKNTTGMSIPNEMLADFKRAVDELAQ